MHSILFFYSDEKNTFEIYFNIEQIQKLAV